MLFVLEFLVTDDFTSFLSHVVLSLNFEKTLEEASIHKFARDELKYFFMCFFFWRLLRLICESVPQLIGCSIVLED